MKARFRIEAPNKLEATITMTFTLEQWQEISAGLQKGPSYGPVYQIREAIQDLVRSATKEFCAYDFPETSEES